MKSEKERRTHKLPVTLSAPPHLAISASNAACTVLFVKPLEDRALHHTKRHQSGLQTSHNRRHRDIKMSRYGDNAM